MKQLVAFDLDGTLAESKQPLKDDMGETLADLLTVADVAVISGGDWPQFDKQVASRLPARADLKRLWLMPTTGTKLFTHKDGSWQTVYAELFDDAEKQKIISAFGLTESSQSLLRANTVYIVTSATQAGPWRILHCPKITWKNTALSALFYPIWREGSWTRTAKTLQKAPRASSGFAGPTS